MLLQTLVSEIVSERAKTPRTPYRKIALKYGPETEITGSTIEQIEKGRIPGLVISARLGIPYQARVQVVGSGVVPNGAQAIGAAQCTCGQWFISNAPCRKRCFRCGPVKKKKDGE